MSLSDVKETSSWVEILYNWKVKIIPWCDPGSFFMALALSVHQIGYIVLLLGIKKLAGLAVGHNKAVTLAYLNFSKIIYLLLWWVLQFQVPCGQQDLLNRLQWHVWAVTSLCLILLSMNESLKMNKCRFPGLFFLSSHCLFGDWRIP